MGSIKENLHSKRFLLNLVLSEDRHDLSNFLWDVDNAKRDGFVDEEDFELFRNGFVVNSIVELKKSPEAMAGRELQGGEILDKINYLSLVPDDESVDVSYTNKDVIDGLCNDDRDFSWWFTCGTLNSLPIETRNKIAILLLEKGQVDKTKYVLESMARSLEFERTESHRRSNSR